LRAPYERPHESQSKLIEKREIFLELRKIHVRAGARLLMPGFNLSPNFKRLWLMRRWVKADAG
jgi:hypothetical protein